MINEIVDIAFDKIISQLDTKSALIESDLANGLELYMEVKFKLYSDDFSLTIGAFQVNPKGIDEPKEVDEEMLTNLIEDRVKKYIRC